MDLDKYGFNCREYQNGAGILMNAGFSHKEAQRAQKSFSGLGKMQKDWHGICLSRQ